MPPLSPGSQTLLGRHPCHNRGGVREGEGSGRSSLCKVGTSTPAEAAAEVAAAAVDAVDVAVVAVDEPTGSQGPVAGCRRTGCGGGDGGTGGSPCK